MFSTSNLSCAIYNMSSPFFTCPIKFHDCVLKYTYNKTVFKHDKYVHAQLIINEVRSIKTFKVTWGRVYTACAVVYSYMFIILVRQCYMVDSSQLYPVALSRHLGNLIFFTKKTALRVIIFYL